ncbi:hypothetical protein NFI96_027653 [Prochilodus magdalenae]|nr:hypothetical protein NFI96_027653 [Prochilodus magdalenae]
MPFPRLCLLLVAAAAASVSTSSYEDIQVKCTDDSVMVTWRVNKDLAKMPSRLLLGSCLPSAFEPRADGGGEALFHYSLMECRFRQKRVRNKLVYENELSFRPLPKPSPAAFTSPVQCDAERSEWVKAADRPAVSVLEGQGRLVFHMGLLNDMKVLEHPSTAVLITVSPSDDLSGPTLSDSVPLGSFIHIWAAVEQQAHQPLMLFMEECVASTSPTLEPESQVYPIITNQGCLVDGKVGYSRFLPRYHSSSVLLQLQAFSFALEQEVSRSPWRWLCAPMVSSRGAQSVLEVHQPEEFRSSVPPPSLSPLQGRDYLAQVYLHCKLAVWDPEDMNEEKKACNYNTELGGWELLDDPSRSDLCGCCDYSCRQRIKRGLRSGINSKDWLKVLFWDRWLLRQAAASCFKTVETASDRCYTGTERTRNTDTPLSLEVERVRCEVAQMFCTVVVVMGTGVLHI